MPGIYLELYTASLALMSLFFIALAVIPRKRFNYITNNRYHPKTLVIMPCKGHEIDLADNLRMARSQLYRNYDVVAVVDSGKDTALDAIRKTKTRYMVFSYRRGSASRKVAALAAAISGFRDYDAYAILDSDVNVGRDWLGHLVAPLADNRVGISTSYPVFKPIGGFWSKVKHAWGYVGQGLEEDDRTSFGWGGSLAFRKELLDSNDFTYFSHSVSDDIALTRIAKRRGLKVAYAKSAEPSVISDDSFSKFWEWSNRQTAIFVAAGGRRYGKKLILYYGAAVLIMLSAVFLGISVSEWYLIFLAPQVISAVKLWIRSGHSYMLAISFIMNFVYLANTVKAEGMRYVTWRGTVYDLDLIRNDSYH